MGLLVLVLSGDASESFLHVFVGACKAEQSMSFDPMACRISLRTRAPQAKVKRSARGLGQRVD